MSATVVPGPAPHPRRDGHRLSAAILSATAVVAILAVPLIAGAEPAGADPAAGAGVGRARQEPQDQGRAGEFNGALAGSILVGGLAAASIRPGRTRLGHRRRVVDFRAELDVLVLPPLS